MPLVDMPVLWYVAYHKMLVLWYAAYHKTSISFLVRVRSRLVPDEAQ